MAYLTGVSVRTGNARCSGAGRVRARRWVLLGAQGEELGEIGWDDLRYSVLWKGCEPAFKVFYTACIRDIYRTYLTGRDTPL
jgi:hypothetical protein